MRIGIVGLGLIGGSIGLELKRSGFASHLVGFDRSSGHGNKALQSGLVDEIREAGPQNLEDLNMIVLATPVDVLVDQIPQFLEMTEKQTIIDVGSTKSALSKRVNEHPHRARFVSCHPMAGTEFSGPDAAIYDLFLGKCCVICDPEKSDQSALVIARNLFQSLGMSLIYMESNDHDVHAAYVSHISHISSFALALTVLAKEKNENRIFQLASGGFDSTVRLAKSSADMWVPIFEQNRYNVLDAVDEHINQLARFRSLLIKGNFDEFYHLIREANEIKRILK